MEQSERLVRALKEISETQAEFAAQTSAKLLKVESAVGRETYRGLNFTLVRNALCGDLTAADAEWSIGEVYLLGSGPWDINEFAAFLEERGFRLATEPSTDVEVVIGSHGWPASKLAHITEMARDGKICVYPQELFVLGLIQGEDPFETLEQDVVDQVGYAHPGIQALLLGGGVWPTWQQPDSSYETPEEDDNSDFASYQEYDWASESALRKLGYTVRQDALSVDERRDKLRRAFTGPLQTDADDERWGSPRSARRLLAISSFLTWLVQFQGADKPEAAEKWLADLGWLRDNFFRDSMGFDWPQGASNPPRSAPRRRKPNEAFMQPLTASPALAAIVGTTPMPRTEIVSRLWAYIKKHDLQDKKNKRMVNTDEKLRAIFKKPQVSMFEMAGLIGPMSVKVRK